MADRLRFAIRTPRGVVLDERLLSARVPAETGQVGLRPREEPLLLGVEPGLVVLRTEGGLRFAATAGGLLESDRERAVLYTPFAASGDTGEGVLAALDRALATPDRELAARRRIAELEKRIAQEVRVRHPGAREPSP